MLVAMYGQGKTRGTTALLDIDATINQACAAITITDTDTSPKYLFYFLQASYEKLRRLSNIGNQENLNADIIRTYPVFLPPLAEQRKIAEILIAQDKVIELYERKIEQLRVLKTTFLQKMFPRYGSDIPDVRIQGFSGAWKIKSFSEITFLAGKKNKDNFDFEPYAITSAQGFVSQKEAHAELGYIKCADRKEYIIVDPKTFAYNPARINIGSIGYYSGPRKVLVSSLYEVFQTKGLVDDRFLWHWFSSGQFSQWVNRLQEGSVRSYFYYNKLCECRILVPSLQEQKQIAAIFDNLDRLISLEQRRYDEEKRKKKALMQLLLTGIVRV